MKHSRDQKKRRVCVAQRRSRMVGMRVGQEGGFFPHKRLEIKYFAEGGGKIRVHLESPLAAKWRRRPRRRVAPREETVITLV